MYHRTKQGRWKNRYTDAAAFGQNDAQRSSFGQTSVTTGGELEQGGGLAYGDVIVNSSNKTDIILAGV